MFVVPLSREMVQQSIPKVVSGKVIIACINSPSSVIILGDNEAIKELESELRAQKVFARELKIETIFQSHYTEPIVPDYNTFLQRTS